MLYFDYPIPGPSQSKLDGRDKFIQKILLKKMLNLRNFGVLGLRNRGIISEKNPVVI